MTRAFKVMVLAAAAVAATSSPASAQVLGTFTWQMQPYCNVVTVVVTQNATGYTLDGFDSQCGGSKRAGINGVAVPNPDGTIGLDFTIVTAPAGLGVHVSASIDLGSLSGPWSDDAGHTGTFAFGAATGGSPRPDSSALSATSATVAAAVTALNTATTGSASGITGEAASTSHGVGATGGTSGVVGRVTSTTPGGYSAGVRGINNGTGGTGIGVIGYQAGSGWGVYGETPSGFGVYGLTTNNSAASVGVRGETFSTNGIAVEAKYSGTGVGTALEVDNGAIRVAGANKAAFVHTATPANKLSANGTDVDNPMCNGDANALLFVTQKLNPSSIVYNNSPIGVYYNTVRSKWEIFNENGAAIPNNAQFNVLVIKQ